MKIFFTNFNKSRLLVKNTNYLQKFTKYLFSSNINKNNNQKNPSFSLDVNKDINNFMEAKKKKLQSQNEKVSLEDDDVDKYIILDPNEDTEKKILDSIFLEGTNNKFVSKIDKIVEEIQMEEINLFEKLGKAKNIYEVELSDNGLSDIENEIDTKSRLKQSQPINKQQANEISENEQQNNKDNNNYEEDFKQKIPNYNSKMINDLGLIDETDFQLEMEKQSYNSNNNKSNYFDEKDLKINNSKSKLPATFSNDADIKSNPISEQIPKNIEYKEKIQKNINYINSHLNSLKNDLVYDFVNENSIGKINNNYQSTKNTVPSEKNTTIKNINDTGVLYDNQEIYKYLSYLEPANHTKSITSELFGTKMDINTLFNKICSHCFETYVNDNGVKGKRKIKNLEKHINEHFTIKSSLGKLTISLFIIGILKFDKMTIEYICQYIENNNLKKVSLVFSSKKDLKTKMGIGTIMIFADNTHLSTMIFNLGVIENANVAEFYVNFFNLLLIEILQNNCKKNLLFFYAVNIKQFDLESKLNKIITRNTIIYVLTLLMEIKLKKFRNLERNLFTNNKMNEQENVKFFIPTVKFLYYKRLMFKHFLKFYKLGGDLNPGEIIFKI